MKTPLLALALASALCACGGGGSNEQTVSNPLVAAATASAQFGYYRDDSRANPVSSIFTRDIDGDGVEEVFFVAFETQPNTPEQYSKTSVHIFGWRNSQFANITAQWLPNQTHLVEGVGDVCFGDFNGDGKLDVFLSAYTDMALTTNPYVLINQGTQFQRISMTPQAYMHSVACGDIDGDGYADVVAAGWGNAPSYMGSPQGLQEYTGWVGGSSGIALAQILGHGNLQVVVTDAGSDKINDTELYTVNVDHAAKSVSYEFYSKLPTNRIGESQHDVRVRILDFDNDGLLDVITIGYRYDAPLNTAHRSEISFFKHLGNGKFADVTDSLRVGFDRTRMVGYFPQIKDIDDNGTVDVFVSHPVWESHSGITLLLNKQGKFYDSYQPQLREAVKSSAQAAVAIGPNRQRYLVIEQAWTQDGQTRISVHPLKFANP